MIKNSEYDQEAPQSQTADNPWLKIDNVGTQKNCLHKMVLFSVYI